LFFSARKKKENRGKKREAVSSLDGKGAKKTAQREQRRPHRLGKHPVACIQGEKKSQKRKTNAPLPNSEGVGKKKKRKEGRMDAHIQKKKKKGEKKERNSKGERHETSIIFQRGKKREEGTRFSRQCG